MPDPVRALAANYLRVGKWSQCAHCHIVHSGPWDSHYCGAEWQTPEMGFVVGEGIDEIRPEWAAAARALREPSDEDWTAALRELADLPCAEPEATGGAPGDEACSCYQECISCRARRAVECLATREPSDEDVAREMSGYEPGTVGFRSCLEDVQSVRAARERARRVR